MHAHRSRQLLRPLLAAFAVVVVGGGACGDDSTIDPTESATTQSVAETTTTTGESSSDATSTSTGGGGASGATSSGSSSSASTGADTTTTTTEPETSGTTGPVEPPDPPVTLEPCMNGSCWSTLTFSAICGSTYVNEDFSSGNFNVHDFALSLKADREVTITLTRTAGEIEPALVILDEQGETVYDGENGAWGPELTIEAVSTGMGSEVASLTIAPGFDQRINVYVTSWSVIDGDFVSSMPTDVTYAYEVYNDCEPETGAFPPPNFDEDDVVNGYHLLPYSEPDGLYTRKADGCSRGIPRLIDVIYTVAERWAELRPEFTPIQVADLNEGPCSNVDHATHDDGTHVDIIVPCATNINCANWIPAVDLAKLITNTGEACGILNNDEPVQGWINPYFDEHHDYEPWFGQYMRSVQGHDGHFHVRVKKPELSCN